MAESSWVVYLLKCSDDSYYAGITQNINQRFERHSLGRGPSYTQARLPVQLVLTVLAKDESEAKIKEKWLKHQTRRIKEGLISAWQASPKRG